MNKGQNLFGGHLINNIIVKRYLLTRVERSVLIKAAVAPVVADGRIDQYCPEPGFERERLIVFVHVLKRFQKAFIQHVLRFFRAGRIAQAYTLCVTEKLLEQRSLRARVIDTTSPYDAREVIVSEGRRLFEEQVQSDL